MKREEISLSSIRESLRQQSLAGLALGDYSVGELYGMIVSAGERVCFEAPSEDWVTVSYVHSNSATANGGMPDWVAEEVEQTLQALVETRIISKRAIWFDKLGMSQMKDWPAIATLQCLAAPVICVPPTRTLEYSRYQVPDRWDPETFDFFTKIENLLRSCSTCGPKCPLEFDSRLLNIAAALRTWPTCEAIIGASSRGAFISFATLDRIRYTISWYQVLLHVALDLAGYGSELYAKSVEMYGHALFQPCSTCVSYARHYSLHEEKNVNCQVIDDTLSMLVMQANRFTLPWARDHEGMDLWSLDGLQKSPGEHLLLNRNNRQRLSSLSRKTVSQKRFEEIAANIIRGRPALSSCYREGDKWLCALILSNIDTFMRAFRSGQQSFEEQYRLQLFKLLKLERPFGELSYKDNIIGAEVNHCIRSPPCDGSRGSTCFFNELSGILKPLALGEFIADRKFSSSERIEIMRSTEQSLRTRLHVQGIALLCYEFTNIGARSYGPQYCGECFKAEPEDDMSKRQVFLVGWKAKDEGVRPSLSKRSDRLPDSVVYSFITIDVNGSGHVQSRGNFSRSNPSKCHRCLSSYIRTEIDGSDDVLEIQINKSIPVATALSRVYECLKKCHAL